MWCEQVAPENFYHWKHHSQKWEKDKRLSNRKLRRESNRVVRGCGCGCEVCSCVFPEKRDVSDPWLMAKDGKHYFDKNKYFKLLRK